MCSCKFSHGPFLLQIPDPAKATEYKKGYVMRKCCVNPDGRHSEYQGLLLSLHPCRVGVCYIPCLLCRHCEFLPCSSDLSCEGHLFMALQAKSLFRLSSPSSPTSSDAMLYSSMFLAHALSISFCFQLFSFLGLFHSNLQSPLSIPPSSLCTLPSVCLLVSPSCGLP